MAKLIEVAQRVQDLYEQNYTPGDRFLDIDDFKFHVATTYSSMLNTFYQQERRLNKQMDGFPNIEIPGTWLLEETQEIQYDGTTHKHYIITKHPVYSFDFDGAATALQGIHSSGKQGQSCCTFRKISLNERRFRQVMPSISKILFYLNGQKEPGSEVVFWGAKENYEITYQYIPEIAQMDNDCLMSDNIVPEIVEAVWTIFAKARQGTVVQKVDDQNPNAVMEQQVNPNLGK